MTTRYFHGTFARLAPGERLLPGNAIGAAVHFQSDHVYAVQVLEAVESVAGLDAAAEWAAYAADVACTNPQHTNPGIEAGFHYDSWAEGMWPACLRVYEVTPDGLVEPDPFAESEDLLPLVRMGGATILAQIDQSGETMPANGLAVQLSHSIDR